MERQHLEYFKIEDFKGLRDLEFDGLSKVNLILGDNNIGKTSVLEALLFDKSPSFTLKCLYSFFLSKSAISNPVERLMDNIDYLRFFVGHTGKIKYSFRYLNSSLQNLSIKQVDISTLTPHEIDNLRNNTLINDRNQLPRSVVSFDLNGEKSFLTSNYGLHRSEDQYTYYPFVASKLAYESDLVQFFSETVNNNIAFKKEFISSLHLLSKNIFDITIDTTTVRKVPVLMVLFDDGSEPIPLFMMGDGTLRLVRILLEILLSKNGRLMIDEIDNGFHFSRVKDIWKIVLRVAIRNNTQLFITTHDSECLKAFKEALEENEFQELQKEVACYTLFRNKEQLVDSVRYDFTEFEHAIDHSLNVRG